MFERITEEEMTYCFEHHIKCQIIFFHSVDYVTKLTMHVIQIWNVSYKRKIWKISNSSLI